MISVLIPVYNGKAYVARAIESVLAQTCQEFELLVLDDGSSDGTADIVKRYPRVRLLQQENMGIGASRRRLVEEARGEWIAFLDHDDYWSAEKLELQVAEIDEGVGLIHARDIFVYAFGGSTIGTWSPNSCYALEHVLPDCRVNMSSVLLRRSAILEVGNFPDEISKAEDWLMWLLLASKWEFRFVQEPSVWTLKHEGSASSPNSAWFEGERHVLEDIILPQFDALYGGYPPDVRERFKYKLRFKLGAIASLKAEALAREGRRHEAWPLHLEAIRKSPTRKGAWMRLGKHLAGL